MKQIHTIRFLLLMVAFLISGCGKNPVEEHPNILFILADDHTTQAISCYGGILEDYAATENIDRIAERGMRFTNCFCTNSICSPSRASILTGKYSNQNGVYILGQYFDSTQVTSNKWLHDNGYQTAVFGKWHLKSVPAGFDEYKVLKVQGRYENPEFLEKGTSEMVVRNGWSTDIITDMTIDFIRNRDAGNPFFVMCQYKTTHDPWASRPPYDTLFRDIELPHPDNLFDTYEHRSEAARRTTLKLELMNQGTFPHERLEHATAMEQRAFIYQQYIKAFLRCGRVLDENVGRLMRFLEKEGLDKHTVVIYTADQGHFLGEHGFFSKRFMYEESLRMPLIIRYPGVVEPGRVCDDFILNIDFAPTIIDLAGLPVPVEMQGESIKQILAGDTPPGWRKAVYYHYWQHLLHRDVTAHYGIRTGRYKLIFYYGLPLGFTEYDPVEPEWELFDLEKDPEEMFNVYGDPGYDRITDSLKRMMKDLKVKYGDEDEKWPPLDSIAALYY